MKTGTCELCERENVETTRHHLVPRMRHNKKVKREIGTDRNHTVPICRPCHAQLHALFTEKELEREYNTIEKLLEHPDVQKWLIWIKTKSFGSVDSKQNKS
jgi:hypothetical protein